MLDDTGGRRTTSGAGPRRCFPSAGIPALPRIAMAALTVLFAAWIAAPAQAQQSGPQCLKLPNNPLLEAACTCAHNPHSGTCRAYDAKDKYVILKDRASKKPAAYLIIPAVALPDISSPMIFKPPFVDFWEYGWQEAEKWVGVNNPPDKVQEDRLGLAINSVNGITQHQLHIHLACIRPDVLQVLKANDQKIGFDPKKPLALNLPPDQDSFDVFKAKGLTGADSPFNLVNETGKTMADQSIAVAETSTAGVYYVMDTSTGVAEFLLDQGDTCR